MFICLCLSTIRQRIKFAILSYLLSGVRNLLHKQHLSTIRLRSMSPSRPTQSGLFAFVPCTLILGFGLGYGN
ncbi:hypothetical protein PAHAL_2G377400 [Panicum hallii]|uniref:Uncharacterized protein n=1 Tax=Panicum hallii TaxID=206008 RepID=A0A2S3H2G2_9POAL|nr:hypothetical protein PAHAL_2G377400 [Panicum hallii]